MSSSPLDHAFELAAHHLRTVSDDVDAAIVEAAFQITDNDDDANDLIDELRGGLWQRIYGLEVVDSWEGHMIGSGSRSIGILDLDARSAWVIGIAHDDDVHRFCLFAECANPEAALEMLPEYRAAVTEI